jgi:hypothetical protein
MVSGCHGNLMNPLISETYAIQPLRITAQCFTIRKPIKYSTL